MTKRELLAIRCRRTELLLRRPADPAIACLSLNAPGCQPISASQVSLVHRDMAQAFADDAVKR